MGYKLIFVSLYPSYLQQYFQKGLISKAIANNLCEINYIDIRDFAKDKHKKVDDYPFAHKQGMLLKADVVYDAIVSIKNYTDYTLLCPSPKGPLHTQLFAKTLSTKKGIVFICGYYEGFDHRLFELLPIQPISIGNYVLNSGELAAMAIAETVLRYVPNFLGNKACIEDDSIANGMLECPQYTQPRDVHSKPVPDVLISGNHKKIENWEREQALKETLTHRPELLINEILTKKDRQLVKKVLLCN